MNLSKSNITVICFASGHNYKSYFSFSGLNRHSYIFLWGSISMFSLFGAYFVCLLSYVYVQFFTQTF